MSITVAIFGRPNVGKSTLFNRLVGRRTALVDNTPGVTRDWREGKAHLGPLDFTIIDTAGFENAGGGDLASRIQAQSDRALARADLALLVIDARVGVTPVDRQLADDLRRTRKPIILIANKHDLGKGEAGWLDAFSLGLGDPVPMAAEHGEGLGLLYDALSPFAADESAVTTDDDPLPVGDDMTETAADRPADAPLQLAIVGRPNVGKSTLINRLIGDERVITGPEAGITRDAIAVDWTFDDRAFRLIDTAGLRRKARISDRIEGMATGDTLQAIRFAHVVILVVDATRGVDRQDVTIARMVADEGRAPVIAINKWDLVQKTKATLDDVRERLDASLPQIRGVRLVTTSALNGLGIGDVLPTAIQAYETWNRQIATGPLNRWLADVQSWQAPPSDHGKPVRLRYMTQTKGRPPTFVVFSNRPELVPDAYSRYLVNGLRDRFDLSGVPIRLTIRRTRNPYAA
jgi:GTP-binding protein